MYTQNKLIHIIFHFSVSKMATRKLPPCHARNVAILELRDYSEMKDNIFVDIGEDDLAACEEEVDGEQKDDIAIQEDLDDDEVLQDADDWAYFEDDNEEEEDSGDNNMNYVAPDGSIWVTNLEAAGRRPRRNMLKELAGFRRGLHPASRFEAFAVFFDNILDATVGYTNTSGR